MRSASPRSRSKGSRRVASVHAREHRERARERRGAGAGAADLRLHAPTLLERARATLASTELDAAEGAIGSRGARREARAIEVRGAIRRPRERGERDSFRSFARRRRFPSPLAPHAGARSRWRRPRREGCRCSFAYAPRLREDVRGGGAVARLEAKGTGVVVVHERGGCACGATTCTRTRARRRRAVSSRPRSSARCMRRPRRRPRRGQPSV